MKNNKESRRKLLKILASGSGAVVAGKSLPESWSKPIVDSVLLPAHADTSTGSSPTRPNCCTISGCYGMMNWPLGTHIDIDVDSAGNVAFHLDVDGAIDFKGTISAKAPCYGGSFQGSKDGITVSGTVVCGRGDIKGTVKVQGQDPADYIAKYGECNR